MARPFHTEQIIAYRVVQYINLYFKKYSVKVANDESMCMATVRVPYATLRNAM